jgi:hypothetical protein
MTRRNPPFAPLSVVRINSSRGAVVLSFLAVAVASAALVLAAAHPVRVPPGPYQLVCSQVFVPARGAAFPVYYACSRSRP